MFTRRNLFSAAATGIAAAAVSRSALAALPEPAYPAGPKTEPRPLPSTGRPRRRRGCHSRRARWRRAEPCCCPVFEDLRVLPTGYSTFTSYVMSVSRVATGSMPQR